MMGGGGGNAGAQKRPLDGAGGNMDQKRARMEPVVPPEMESLPQEGSSMDLEALKRRFDALQQEVSGMKICELRFVVGFLGAAVKSAIRVLTILACPAVALMTCECLSAVSAGQSCVVSFFTG
jgi:hypothetical protein